MPNKPTSPPKAYKMMCANCGYRWALIETDDWLRKESITWIDEENECEESRAVIHNYASNKVFDVYCHRCGSDHTVSIDVWHIWENCWSCLDYLLVERNNRR